MPKIIPEQLHADARLEYINTIKTLAQVADKFKISPRTVDKWSMDENWTQHRKDYRIRTLNKAREVLDEKLQENVVEWDSDMLDIIAALKTKIKDMLTSDLTNSNGEAYDLSLTELQKASDTLAKINEIQRKVTNRDIQKVQQVESSKMEEMRELILNGGQMPQEDLT